jgi:tetratricopeptide (TPR) repeat protein
MMETSFTPAAEAKKGLSAYQSQDYQGAIQAFTAAIQGYTGAGDMLNAAEMANNLSVVFLRTGKARDAWEAVKETDLVFEKAGDKKRLAMALGNQAAALEGLHKIKPAIEKYEQCAALLKEVADLDNRATVLQTLSKLQMQKRQPLDSLFTMQAALQNKQHLTLVDRLLQSLLKIVFRLWGV